MINLTDIKTIYFVGIGGIGMSAIARYFNSRGVAVYGYDRTETELTKKLVEEGMHIHYEERIDLIPENIDLVVYTPAVPSSHKELVYFRANDLPVKKRAEVLGIISRGMKTAAIAGTHGKTTTTSLLTYLLKVGGVDCNAFLGGIAQNFSSNFVEGKSDWVVVEADEYDRSFLHLSPDLAAVTSMDADHLDIYGDEASLHETGFKAFASKMKEGGKLWVQHQFASSLGVANYFDVYGIDAPSYSARNIRVENGFFTFDYTGPKGKLEGLELAIAGRHNVENATAAVTIALELGVTEEKIRQGLANFKGIKRRFEIIYRKNGLIYVDDYAHHPSELKAAIDAAKQYFKGKKVSGVFQPHLYSRTRDFVDGFAEALDQLDEVFLMDIYPARELPIEGVTSDIIFNKMKLAHKKRVQKENLMATLASSDIEVLLTLGAGDIDRFRDPIKEWLTNK